MSINFYVEDLYDITYYAVFLNGHYYYINITV